MDEPLTLVVFPGADGTASIYEDDGRSFDYRRGEWMRIQCDWRDADRRLTLRLAPGSRMLAPQRRAIVVRLAGSKETRPVVFEGRPISVRF